MVYIASISLAMIYLTAAFCLAVFHVGEWSEFAKNLGILIAAIGGTLTTLMSFLGFVHIRVAAALAKKNVDLAEKSSKDIKQQVNNVRDDIADNTEKTELVVKQTNGALEQTVRRVVEEVVAKELYDYGVKRDTDLPKMIKPAVKEAIEEAATDKVAADKVAPPSPSA